MQVPSSFARIEPELQRELRSLLESRTQPLYRMVEYQLGWTDEHGQPANAGRLQHHGVACALAAEAAGGALSKVMPAAAALELAHQFIRVHSEIQDGTPNNSRRFPVWWVWGPAQAINAGDGLHALARLSLVRLSDAGVPAPEVLDLLARMDKACLEVCEAQYQELSLQERLDVSLDTYVRVAEGKIGALLGCALELGSLLGGLQPEQAAALRQAGRALGLALQAQADIAVLWERRDNDPIPGDVLNKRKLLPFVLAFPSAQPKVKRELGGMYMQRMLEAANLPQIATILASLGAREASEQHLGAWREQAFGHLDSAALSGSALGNLQELFAFLLEEARTPAPL